MFLSYTLDKDKWTVGTHKADNGLVGLGFTDDFLGYMDAHRFLFSLTDPGFFYNFPFICFFIFQNLLCSQCNLKEVSSMDLLKNAAFVQCGM